ENPNPYNRIDLIMRTVLGSPAFTHRRPAGRICPMALSCCGNLPNRTANDMSRRLITALQSPACYPHETTEIRVLETHISWVLLTGPYAYKIKKPVNPGFLDFSTLEK